MGRGADARQRASCGRYSSSGHRLTCQTLRHLEKVTETPLVLGAVAMF